MFSGKIGYLQLGQLNFIENARSLFQVFFDRRELFQGGFEVGSDYSGGGEIRAAFDGVVFEPEDVVVHLIVHERVVERRSGSRDFRANFPAGVFSFAFEIHPP